LGTECIWTGGDKTKRQLEEHSMKSLCENDTFSFETPRTAGRANYFGADLGEVLAIRYWNTTLPGYRFLIDDSGMPLPTIIYTSGYVTMREGRS
jgi:hypothetical protein